MNDDAKYIMVETEHGETPIVFPCFLAHSSVALGFAGEVLSAGFVCFTKKYGAIRAHAYGESISLKVKSLEGDSRLIEKALGIE